MPTAAVIVAYPDNETLWCGGFILQRPSWHWFILSLCRSADEERATRFAQVLQYFGAQGQMLDLEDGVKQEPLDQSEVRHMIREGLPRSKYDIILTRGAASEPTRHRQSDDCYRAVVSLWAEGQLSGQLKLFAYDDLDGATLPQVRSDADELCPLDEHTFSRKYHIIHELYGYHETSWQARTTPKVEGFFNIGTPHQIERLLRAKPPAENGLRGAALLRNIASG